jgi:hypothetical protein
MGSDMENGTDRKIGDERIDDLLASFGADRARWPEADRLRGSGTPEAEADAHDVDRLLSLATAPAVPAGAIGRLMAKLADETPAIPASTAPGSTPDVVAFPVRAPAARPPQRRFIRYAAALPLAASLALGFYLGAQGSLDTVLPTAITGSVALNDDAPDDLGGVGEAEALAEETTS